jgi:hypothetical protein
VRATELRPGSPEFPGDRGTSLTVGVVGGKDWSMVRGNYVNLEDAVGVVERGLDLLDQSGTGLARRSRIFRAAGRSRSSRSTTASKR